VEELSALRTSLWAKGFDEALEQTGRKQNASRQARLPACCGPSTEFTVHKLFRVILKGVVEKKDEYLSFDFHMFRVLYWAGPAYLEVHEQAPSVAPAGHACDAVLKNGEKCGAKLVNTSETATWTSAWRALGIPDCLEPTYGIGRAVLSSIQSRCRGKSAPCRALSSDFVPSCVRTCQDLRQDMPGIAPAVAPRLLCST
jgi:hypothetical protein